MAAAVRALNLSHHYPSSRGQAPRPTLNDVSFSVDRGSITAILGPNGGGKTTLFRILSTSLLPSQGSVNVLDLDLATRPHEVRRRIGVVFQNPSLDKKLTLRENLRHHGRLYGLHGSELNTRIEASLRRLSLTDRADEWVETLSGGLQRRGEIAKSLLHQPSLLLMDEPSTGLDPRARRDMWEALASLKQEGTTILLTTHDMQEADSADRVFILDRGRLVTEGTPADLKRKIGGDVVVVHATDAAALARGLQEKFGSRLLSVDGTIQRGAVRIEMPDGHKFIPTLVETFPGVIESVAVGKPTLDDVFVNETGHAFGDEQNETAEKP